MLPPRVVIFTPSNLLGSANNAAPAASEALLEIGRRNIPLILSTRGTRAQLEALRRKIEHGHPFITEGGGGLFVPDGYFALRLEGAKRAGRYLCVPFGRSAEEAGAAVEDIAREAGAEVVRYAEMSAREIARNTGMPERDAQASRERGFSERFFFAGNADLAFPPFEKIAREHQWQIRRCEPFWELRSGNDEGKAVRYLMRLYRQALRSRIRSVGIGASFEDVSLLAASDQAFILPASGGRFDDELLAKLPNSARIAVPGAPGWNQTVLDTLSRS
jgi:predicted mannosyl-3-phosphoglycerate phosphatase (HAD superfamily)